MTTTDTTQGGVAATVSVDAGSALLTALNGILGIVQSGGTNIAADVAVASSLIETLENLVPKLVKLGSAYVAVAQNIMATLSGNVSDADLLARLKPLQAQADADFDAAAAAADPEAAAEGQAAEAADKAADPNQQPLADPSAGGQTSGG